MTSSLPVDSWHWPYKIKGPLSTGHSHWRYRFNWWLEVWDLNTLTKSHSLLKDGLLSFPLTLSSLMSREFHVVLYQLPVNFKTFFRLILKYLLQTAFSLTVAFLLYAYLWCHSKSYKGVIENESCTKQWLLLFLIQATGTWNCFAQVPTHKWPECNTFCPSAGF